MKKIGKGYKKLKVGDLLYNPIAGDFWIVSERYNDKEDKDEKFVVLVHADYNEDLCIASSFYKVGNIYDYAKERFEVKNNKKRI